VQCGHLHQHGRTVAVTHGELPLLPISVLSYRATPAPSAAHTGFGMHWATIKLSAPPKNNWSAVLHAHRRLTADSACARASPRIQPSYFVSHPSDACHRTLGGA
jgi:hypothetical protein